MRRGSRPEPSIVEVGGVIHISEKKRHGHVQRAVWERIMAALATTGVGRWDALDEAAGTAIASRCEMNQEREVTHPCCQSGSACCLHLRDAGSELDRRIAVELRLQRIADWWTGHAAMLGIAEALSTQTGGMSKGWPIAYSVGPLTASRSSRN